MKMILITFLKIKLHVANMQRLLISYYRRKKAKQKPKNHIKNRKFYPQFIIDRENNVMVKPNML